MNTRDFNTFQPSPWFLRDGDAARPSYVARRTSQAHMPELVPTWERLGPGRRRRPRGADARALRHAPAARSGCSQAVIGGSDPVLVRNYDYDPGLLEGVISSTALTGRPCSG